jgi:hypothetical protein
MSRSHQLAELLERMIAGGIGRQNTELMDAWCARHFNRTGHEATLTEPMDFSEVTLRGHCSCGGADLLVSASKSDMAHVKVSIA